MRKVAYTPHHLPFNAGTISLLPTPPAPEPAPRPVAPRLVALRCPPDISNAMVVFPVYFESTVLPIR